MTSSTVAAHRTALFALATISALALAGCAAAPTNTPSGDVAGEWVLISGSSGARPLSFDQSVTITLDIATSGSGGLTPCNSYGANVEGGDGAVLANAGDTNEGGPIRIAVTRQTAAACESSDLQDLEERFLAILPQVDAALIDNGLLVLTGGGSQLLFEAATAAG